MDANSWSRNPSMTISLKDSFFFPWSISSHLQVGLNAPYCNPCQQKQMSNQKKPALLSIESESWLFHKDPYFMVYEIIPHITGGPFLQDAQICPRNLGSLSWVFHLIGPGTSFAQPLFFLKEG